MGVLDTGELCHNESAVCTHPLVDVYMATISIIATWCYSHVLTALYLTTHLVAIDDEEFRTGKTVNW